MVCPQAEWTGEVGDSLRAIFTAPVPYLNQIEPIFDVLRVTERGFTGMVADHRNILKILVDPELKETTTAVQYDVTSDPQIVMTLQGPQRRSAGEIPLGKPGEPRLCARKGRTRPRREGQRDLWQPRHRVGHSQNVRRGDEGSEGLHAGLHRNPTSSGRATNTRPPVRDSSSTPTPTKASSRSRKRRW